MTYGYCRDAALKLLQQYRLGERHSPVLQHQCDYLKGARAHKRSRLLVALTAAARGGLRAFIYDGLGRRRVCRPAEDCVACRPGA
jgi:hypothetical protein